MATSRIKRWNGKTEGLTSDYLKNVLQQMLTYGERVQFGQSATAQGPTYQVTNGSDKKITFDGNHHLLHPKDDEFSDKTLSVSFTLEQVQAAIAAGGFRVTSGTRSNRVVRSGAAKSTGPRTNAAKITERIDAEKYQYFKANAEMLPAEIRSHSSEISELMQRGMSAEEAFEDVLRRHF